jgi:hypothetical protein
MSCNYIAVKDQFFINRQNQLTEFLALQYSAVIISAASLDCHFSLVHQPLIYTITCYQLQIYRFSQQWVWRVVFCDVWSTGCTALYPWGFNSTYFVIEITDLPETDVPLTYFVTQMSDLPETGVLLTYFVNKMSDLSETDVSLTYFVTEDRSTRSRCFVNILRHRDTMDLSETNASLSDL